MTPNWVRTDRVEPLDDAANGRHDELVLLIENDPSIARMYALGLSLSGYQVHVAASLNSAWTEVNQSARPPELIVLDLELPTTSGLDVLNDLKATPSTSRLPVIVLADDEEDLAEAYRRGATYCHPRYRTTPRQLASYVGAALNEGLSLDSP